MSDSCYLRNRIYLAGLYLLYPAKLPILSQWLPTAMLPGTDFRSLWNSWFSHFLIRTKMLTLNFHLQYEMAPRFQGPSYCVPMWGSQTSVQLLRQVRETVPCNLQQCSAQPLPFCAGPCSIHLSRQMFSQPQKQCLRTSFTCYLVHQEWLRKDLFAFSQLL